jgi:hypothetical protein
MGHPLWQEDGSVFYNVQYTIYFTVSDLRPGPCIYIPQEQGGPVIPPGTGYELNSLLPWHFSLYSLGENPTENTVFYCPVLF